MKKIILLLLSALSLTSLVNAQTTYTEQFATGSPQLSVDIGGSDRGQAAFGDIDGDGDIDIFKTGETAVINYTAQIHLNDGKGNFTLKDQGASPIRRYRYSSCELVDVDGDTDLDILVAGAFLYGTNIATELYLNDGAGNFTLSTQTFVGLQYSDIQSIDIENDGDLDILMSGYTKSNNDTTILYKNNGSGVFTLDATNSFSPMFQTTIVSEDLNNDGYTDIILAKAGTIEVYKNMNGIFTLLDANTLPGQPYFYPNIKLIDLENDGDKDIIVLGSYWSNGKPLLYTNNGNFSFAEYTSGPFPSASFGYTSMDVADVDNDGNMDLVYAARTNSSHYIDLLMGNSDSTFTPNTTFDKSVVPLGLRAICKFVDITGDGLLDIIMTGEDANSPYTYIPQTVVHINQGSGSFSKIERAIPKGYLRAVSVIGDIDADGDNDLLIAEEVSWGGRTHLYSNDGSGNLTKTNSPFDNIGGGILLRMDIDGDSDLDVVISGLDSATRYTATKVYRNNGSGNYIEIANPAIDSLSIVKGEAVDYDKDGDMDIIASHSRISRTNNQEVLFFKNNGSGIFTADLTNTIATDGFASMTQADYNADGNVDLFIAEGYGYGGLYLNNGTGTFTKNSATFTSVEYYESAKNIDLDNDGDMDIITSAYDWDYDLVTTVHINDGTGTFTKLVNGVPAKIGGKIEVVDLDGDAYIDFICGTKAYKNNMGTSLTEITNYSFMPYERSWHIATGDLDGDNKDDFFFSGETASGEVVSTLYYTDGCQVATYTDNITACDSLLWLNGNTYFASNDKATYTIVNGASSGCDSIVLLNLIISTSPTISITKVNNSLEADAGYSDYQWYLDNNAIAGATSNTHTPTANGDYRCEATDNGCMGVSTTFNFTTLSVREPSSNISIYPNPASSSITIQTNEQTESISVFSADGRLVLNQDGSSKQIDISTLPNGIYTIQVRQQQGTGYAKFIKN